MLALDFGTKYVAMSVSNNINRQCTQVSDEGSERNIRKRVSFAKLHLRGVVAGATVRLGPCGVLIT
jgi:hypothetical protein